MRKELDKLIEQRNAIDERIRILMDLEKTNEFNKKVDELCKKKGLTHRQLSKMVGISEVTMSRYLSAQRRLALEPFMKMCDALGIAPAELYKVYKRSNMEERVENYMKAREGEEE